MGRPAIQITKAVLKKVEHLASTGLNREEIALSLGMGRSTLHEKMVKYPDFLEAITRGAAKGEAVVSNKLFTMVKQGNFHAIKWYEQTRCGRSEKINIENTGTVTHKHEGVSRAHEILGEFRGRGSSQSLEDPLPN